MSKTDFAKAIIDRLSESIGTDGSTYTEGSASLAMLAVADAISTYIRDNTKVTVSYSGMIPGTPPVPDPLVTDTFQVLGMCNPTGPSNSFDDWIKHIETNIIAGYQLAPKGEGGLVFPQTPFLTPGITIMQCTLKALHDTNDESPQQKIWETICSGIMDWLNTITANMVPGAATNSLTGSTGIANITQIIIT